MQRYNDAFDLVHAFPRLLRKELPRERARARPSCFIRRENEAGTDGGQRRERIEWGRLRVSLIALNLPRKFYEIYSGTGAI